MNSKRIVKWTGKAVGGLLTIILAIVGFQLFGYSQAVNRVYDVAPLNVTASTD